ncbi:MAG: zf-HC2 domain-containing protein, partial [Usitatibacteraceae bacterium]
MSSEIEHHPDDATLVSYGAGTLPEALTAVVAAHVSMCPRCRAEVADLNLLGATLMLSSPGTGETLA